LSGDTHDDNGDITIYNQNQNTMQILVPGTINKTKNFNLSITFSYSEYETTTVQTTIVMQESLSAPYSISYVNNSAIPETATTDGIHFGMTIGSTCSVKYNTIGDQTFTTGT
jgi:hypothetical protein